MAETAGQVEKCLPRPHTLENFRIALVLAYAELKEGIKANADVVEKS